MKKPVELCVLQENDVDHPMRFIFLKEEDQVKLLDWISLNILEAERKHPYSSYALKHIYEKEKGEYVENGQFKGAMLLCGHYPTDRREKNWIFKIKNSAQRGKLK
jgi:hypothetical protein